MIGLEREVRQKSAGLRTHVLVGLGAALFMLISKYGFNDVLRPGLVLADPSRVAAQIVSGIGFIGAGLIFVRSDAVRGLTTAAAVWVTAAIGAAAGAGLPVLAGLSTLAYLLVAVVFPPLLRLALRWSPADSVVRIRYPEGRGMLRTLLQETTSRGFIIDGVQTEHHRPTGALTLKPDGSFEHCSFVIVTLHLRSRRPVHELVAALSELDQVEAVAGNESGDAITSDPPRSLVS